jgi:Bacteriophage abortive infection AbiH
MNPSILYIIGNGFDRHHGIRSDYKDFGEFLRQVDSETYDVVDTYFTVDDSFWWEFEARLADFDAEALLEDASIFMLPYGADEWSDSAHHDFQYETERAISAISVTMRSHFSNWVRQLEIPRKADLSGTLLNLDPSASFLTFNYTPTLQNIYGVRPSQVLHIHGSAFDPTDKLVLGHGWQPRPEDTFNARANPERDDTRLLEGYQIADNYFAATFKPTSEIIAEHRAFFESLSKVREVRIMGHSLASVDAPYIREVLNSIDQLLVRWQVSYHSDVEASKNVFQPYGVDESLVSYARLSEFP